MAQRCHHYERAFETYLRLQRIPYVAVDEARKALLPASPSSFPSHRVREAPLPAAHDLSDPAPAPTALKSFDFVLYADRRNLLIDVKGRKVGRRAAPQSPDRASIPVAAGTLGHRTARPPRRTSRLECWVTEDDIDSLRHWRVLFGEGFDAAFVFVYWCDEQPPDGLFQEVFEYQGRWYALRAITLDTYCLAMKPRSARWKTLDLPTREFERLSQPFCPPWAAGRQSIAAVTAAIESP